MKKIFLSSKCSFIALLLLLSIFNERILFAAAQHDIIPTCSRQQAQPARLGADHDTDSYDGAEQFTTLKNNHQIPENFHLVEKLESILIIGMMSEGKTTLANRFGGFAHNAQAQVEIREEAKYPEEEIVKNRPGTIGHKKRAVSCTKMPNILLNQKKNWVFVDCPGFDDHTRYQSLFIQASVQIIVNKIKKLKAVLCVIDKKTLEGNMRTLQEVQDHKLSKLVIYLHQLLEEPLKFCRANLVLVVNKTGGEYPEEHAQRKLKAYFDSLGQIRERCKGNQKKDEWHEYGQPILDFVDIFSHGIDGQKQIICISNLTEQSNFDRALTKIGEINTLLNHEDIKLALPKEAQEKLIALILKSNVRLLQLDLAYKACTQEEVDKAIYKKEDQIASSFSKRMFIGLVIVIGLTAVILRRGERNKKDKFLIVTLAVAVISVSLSYLYDCCLASLSQMPSEQAINNCTSLAEARNKVVGIYPRQERFYYELTGLGKELKHNIILQMYRTEYERKFPTQ